MKEKVKEVAQSCLTLCNPVDCSLPGQPTRLLCPWDSPGENTGVGCHFPSPGDLPDPVTEPARIAADSLTSELLGKHAI